MDWHKRYTQQARWTRDLRAYLFDKVNLWAAQRVLEVGCGTGAVLSELPDHLSRHGLDIDRTALARCRIHVPSAFLVEGNALQLPDAKETFDLVYCHFLLLWVNDPLEALLEMKRVAKPGAHIIAFAEPDYSGRVDEPRELVRLGQWQSEALKQQGADPTLGARLAEVFFKAGIELIETGTIQSVESDPSPEEWETEWAVIEADLAGYIPDDDLRKLKNLDHKARAQGERVLHVPTYFAWGHT